MCVARNLERISHNPSDSQYTFGYRRYSLLSASLTAVILIVGSSIVMYESILRLINPETLYIPGMFGLAVLGMLANGLCLKKLSDSHSFNARMVKHHIYRDLLSRFAILTTSVILLFRDIPQLDSILSIVIVIVIMMVTLKHFKRVLAIIVQRVPDQFNVKFIEQ